MGWNLLKNQGMYGARKVADSEASTMWVSSFSNDGSEVSEGRRKESNIFITYKI